MTKLLLAGLPTPRWIPLVYEYLDADIRNPAAILNAAAGLLDFRQPVALMLMGIMGHFTGEEAHPIVRQLLIGLPSGSYFALYDGASTTEAFNQAQEGYNASGAVPYYLRSPGAVRPVLRGPGVGRAGRGTGAALAPRPRRRAGPDLLLLRSRAQAIRVVWTRAGHTY